MAKITLYTKLNCKLCSEMKKVIQKIKSETDFVYEEVYIENDINAFEKYKEKIPVLMIDGRIFAKYRVDEEKLREKIKTDFRNI